MKPAQQKRKVWRGQRGYALLVMIFILALLVVGTMALTQNVITEGRRQKEEEMIWRGKQYARGVKLYFRKTNHFPATLEDLTKPKTGVRFMRQAYSDPMNSVDGSWRVIYVSAGGQLIGSMRNALPPGSSVPFGNPISSLDPTTNPSGATTSSSGAVGTSSQPNAATEPEERANFYGVSGSAVVGVGSKVDKQSIRWYQKAKNYQQFEFFWLPTQDVLSALPSSTSQGIGTPIGGQSPSPTPSFPVAHAPPQTGSPDAPPPPASPPN
jgi:hypothetical protein